MNEYMDLAEQMLDRLEDVTDTQLREEKIEGVVDWLRCKGIPSTATTDEILKEWMEDTRGDEEDVIHVPDEEHERETERLLEALLYDENGHVIDMVDSIKTVWREANRQAAFRRFQLPSDPEIRQLFAEWEKALSKAIDFGVSVLGLMGEL